MGGEWEKKMEEKELADSLRDVFRVVNREARLVGGSTLERCLGNVLEGPGVNWLLDTAQALGLADGDEVRRNVAVYRELLCSETGRAELKLHLKRRRGQVERWRRQMVAHIRAWQAERSSLRLQWEGSVEAHRVYGVLTRGHIQVQEGEAGDEEGLHHHQGER